MNGAHRPESPSDPAPGADVFSALRHAVPRAGSAAVARRPTPRNTNPAQPVAVPAVWPAASRTVPGSARRACRNAYRSAPAAVLLQQPMPSASRGRSARPATAGPNGSAAGAAGPGGFIAVRQLILRICAAVATRVSRPRARSAAGSGSVAATARRVIRSAPVAARNRNGCAASAARFAGSEPSGLPDPSARAVTAPPVPTPPTARTARTDVF